MEQFIIFLLENSVPVWITLCCSAGVAAKDHFPFFLMRIYLISKHLPTVISFIINIDKVICFTF